MASYLLFAENEIHGNSLAEKYGLQALGGPADSAMAWVQTESSPTGKRGLLGFWSQLNSVHDRRFDPGSQTWRQLPGSPLWLGTEDHDPLCPEDIQRTKIYRSNPVTLEDGQEWLIPVANALPHYWGIDDEGQFSRRPKGDFAEFCGKAETLFKVFNRQQADGEPWTLETDWDYLNYALQLNYKLTPQIVTALQLIGDDSAADLVAATVEMKFIRAVEDEKKNQTE